MTIPPLPSGGALRVAVVNNLDFIEDCEEPPGTHDFDGRANAEIAEVAAHVAVALEQRGYTALRFGVRDCAAQLIPQLREHDVDVVFNLVESLGGDPRREPEIPSLLAKCGMPHTGNSAQTLRNALRKDVVRELLSAHHIPVARGCVVDGPHTIDAVATARLRFPLFVKPAASDGSIGIDQASLVTNTAALTQRLEYLAANIAGPFLVEEYLAGPEINVAIVPDDDGMQLFPTMIDFSGTPTGYHPIVTYACKWDELSPEYAARTVPLGNRVTSEVRRDLLRTAEAAFSVLGGHSYGRVDMRLDDSGRARVIDVNPNSDLHPEAGYAIALREAQLPYVELIDILVQQAVRRARPHAPTFIRARSGIARCAFAVG